MSADPVADRPAWLVSLDGDGRFTPASHPALLADATARLGGGPVRWAVELGHRMAADIIDQIPAFGGDTEAFEALRMGTESSVLGGMLRVVDDGRPTAAVTDEGLEGDREFVRRGIGLHDVLRGVRIGHALAARELLEAVASGEPERRRALEMERVSDLLFVFIDGYASAMTEEYLSERDRWAASTAAAREELEGAILASRPVSAGTASSTLGYPLDAVHVAAVLWHLPGDDGSAADLQRVAGRLAPEGRARGTLLVPHGAATLWAWSAWPSLDAAERAYADLQAPDAHLALGPPARGLDGFRQSHLESAAAVELVRQGPASVTGQVNRYVDVELAVLLLQDRDLAEAFVARELGVLARPDADVGGLLETVAVYLGCDRSLAAACRHLHVARNTVAYRVKKFEALTGRDLRVRRLELEAALRLAPLLRRRPDGRHASR